MPFTMQLPPVSSQVNRFKGLIYTSLKRLTLMLEPKVQWRLQRQD